MDTSRELTLGSSPSLGERPAINRRLGFSLAYRRVNDPVLVASVLLLAVYLLLIGSLPPGGFYAGDQGVKYEQVVALAQTGTPVVGRVDDLLSVFRPDFTGQLYRQVGESYQATFSLAYGAVTLPFYLLLGMRGLALPSAMGAVLAAYAGGQIAKQVGARRPEAVVLLIGLLSPVVFYALVLWEHALEVGLITCAVLLSLERRYFAAGLLVGLAAWAREEAYLLAPALILATFVAYGWRTGLRLIRGFVPGLLVGIAPLYVYNLRTVGTAAGLHGSQPIMPSVNHWQLFLLSRLLSVERNLVPLGVKKWLAVLAIVLAYAVIARLTKRRQLPALWIFWAGVTAIGLLEIVTDVVHLRADSAYVPLLVGSSFTDVFFFAFAALATIPLLLRRDSAMTFLWILAVGYLLSIVAVAPRDPGAGWGPRYLIGAYPFVAILAWLGFEAVRGRVPRLALISVLVCGLAVQVIGVVHLNNTESQWAELNAELAALQPKVVVTAIWWLPQVAASTVGTDQWLGVTDKQDLAIVATSTSQFWWVWTSEPPTGFPDRQLTNTRILPDKRFSLIATRDLGTRGLEADLYQVAP